MPVRCVALLSGGLDSILAIRVMQEQGITVEALNFKTIFTCCQDVSAQAAYDLGVRLTVVGQEDDYLDLVRSPRFGRGKAANPCVDCRIYMFESAKRFMEQVGASFVVSGEVIGQRPMSQKGRDLKVIAEESNLDDLLLRPLSAKLLPATLPERKGWVDREQLFDFSGRSRKGLIKLAQRFGITQIPSPSTGCSLTEPQFSRKVFDLNRQKTPAKRWDYELLNVGRHFRADRSAKIIVGRDEAENAQLMYAHRLPDANSTAMLWPDNFSGPAVMIIGDCNETVLGFATGMLQRYGKTDGTSQPMAFIHERGQAQGRVPVSDCEAASQAKSLASIT